MLPGAREGPLKKAVQQHRMRLKALQAPEDPLRDPLPLPKDPTGPQGEPHKQEPPSLSEPAPEGTSRPSEPSGDPSTGPPRAVDQGKAQGNAEPAAPSHGLANGTSQPHEQQSEMDMDPAHLLQPSDGNPPPEAEVAGPSESMSAIPQAAPPSLADRITSLREELLELLGDVEGDVRPVWGSPGRMKALRSFLRVAQTPQVRSEP